MIINHFPTIGLVITAFTVALFTNNELMKRTCLCGFTICGILGAPTTSRAPLQCGQSQPPMAGITTPQSISPRYGRLLTLIGLAFTGVGAYCELWRYRYLGRFSNNALYLVLIFAVITLGIMAETGHRGGLINHPESHGGDADRPQRILSPNIELEINNVIWFVPANRALLWHSLVFGTVLAVVLRVLGSEIPAVPRPCTACSRWGSSA
jgi:hypothetical protein